MRLDDDDDDADGVPCERQLPGAKKCAVAAGSRERHEWHQTPLAGILPATQGAHRSTSFWPTRGAGGRVQVRLEVQSCVRIEIQVYPLVGSS